MADSTFHHLPSESYMLCMDFSMIPTSHVFYTLNPKPSVGGGFGKPGGEYECLPSDGCSNRDLPSLSRCAHSNLKPY